ncbi:hypothetical protein D3C74_393090 [compost metagenome]
MVTHPSIRCLKIGIHMHHFDGCRFSQIFAHQDVIQRLRVAVVDVGVPLVFWQFVYQIVQFITLNNVQGI